MLSSARKAVQTLMPGSQEVAEEPIVEHDPLYATGPDPQAQETPSVEEGPENPQQAQIETLQEQVGRLATAMDTRLADKDRFISHLEGQVQSYNRATAFNVAPGGTPVQDPNPALDEDTAALFVEKYKEEPAQAMIALVNHMERRQMNRTASTNAVRDQQAQHTVQIEAAERNVQRQVALALQNFGDGAQRLVGDFKYLTDSGAGSSADYANTWLGGNILQDNTLAVSPQGVYRLIELEVMKAEGNTEQPVVQPTAAVTHGIARPAAPSRTVAAPIQDSADDRSPEDRIADSIMNSAQGEDHEARSFLTGTK